MSKIYFFNGFEFSFLVRPGRPQIKVEKLHAFSAQIQYSRGLEMTCFTNPLPLITEVLVKDITGNIVTKVGIYVL